jgi:hypothetical protein
LEDDAEIAVGRRCRRYVAPGDFDAALVLRVEPRDGA